MNTYGGSEHGDLARAADQGLSADQCQCLVSYKSIYFYSGYRRHGLIDAVAGYGECVACWWTSAYYAGAFCLQKARDCFLIGAGGGPPCETFSAGRCVNDDGSAPVRLKPGSHIWERPGISLKQNNARPDIPARTRFLPSFMTMLAKET